MRTVHVPSPSSAPTRAAAEPAAREPGWARAGVVVVGLALALGMLLVAFGWPAVRSGPHDVPLGLAGPRPAVAQVEQGLAGAGEGAFRVTRYADEAALRAAILDRDAYGGFVLGADGPRLLITSAASPAVAQALTSLGTAMASRQGVRLPVQDVVPLPAADPRGAGLAAAALPIALGGVLPAVVLARTFRRRPGVRLGAAIGVALAVGATVTAVLRFWFGSLGADNWTDLVRVWLGLSLGVAAISLALLGLEAVAGRAGLALGGAVVLLLGNPLSGLPSAPELLPDGWGTLGQLLPPGANGALLRSTAYFDGAAAARPVLVLCCWIAVGLVLYAVAALRDRPGRGHDR
jgi:hypothetical protein